ncbi:MAG: polysaccharide biosynthesis tyrosine autokinase [Deltaproteobacteria bacterium]|nr:polysaccharide biosynthesis tyrosine autokinase [Deltaproteobacteria bacterium]
MTTPSPSPLPRPPMPLGPTAGGPNAKGESFDLRTQVLILWAHKWVVLLVAIVVAGGVAFWTLRQPRIYEAGCTIEYDPTPPRPLGTKVEDVSSPLLNAFSNREFYETQNRIIGSRVVAEMVVRRLGLHRDADFLGVPAERRDGFQGATVEEAAEAVRGGLLVAQERDTRLVNIRFRDRDPERAQRIANAIADAYIEKTMNDRMSSTVSALEWLGTQVDELEGELHQADEALHHFKQEHDVLSLSMEDRQNLIANDIELLSRSLTETHVHRIELQSRVSQLRQAVETDPLTAATPAIEALQSVQELRATLRLKQAEMEALRTRYGAAHPQMVALQTEVDSIRRDLEVEIRTVLRASEAELRETQGTERGLQGALTRANQQGMELNHWEMEYGHLVRERDSKAAIYDLVLKRSAEADLTRMLRVTHVRVVDRALVPRSSVAPRVTLNLSAGILAGLLLGIVVALLAERSDRRIRNLEDIEALGLAVLGLVPRIGAATATGPRRRRQTAQASANKDLIAHHQPMSGVAENLRTIRTNLSFMGADGGLRAFVITSASPREGKSTVAINLAITLAQSGKRILLVDTDLRRPRVHRAFGLTARRGVTTALVGEAKAMDVVLTTEVPGLDIVACGPIPPNPSELLHTDAFRHFVEAVRDKYDHVMFDSPPLGAVTDAAILAAQLDGVIVVVKSQSTTREALRVTARQLNDVGARVLGAVFNDVDLSHGRYGEGTYYYYRREGYYTSDTDDHGGGSGEGGASGGTKSDGPAPAATD